MRIAFATQDSLHINAHFGWARQLDVYEVDTTGYTFLEALKFGGDLKEDGNEDKLEPKVKALQNCTIVYVSAIGGSAAARLIRKNITPIKTDSGTDEIEDVLVRLVQSLKNSPPPWLRKALSKGQSALTFDDDFETIEEEVIV
ncbi:nitrogen fixation protein [Leptolyngbya sp. Heron Island J]|uniref:nitrogen fixation protein NifX n=1 Tax=Leptolyngbya sp. Heron Island J TaxID=1385935 RepID=UPI0003B9D878|nr:nitrogen fixation protein NifX [Leptolyngbya sp. Heron Island J]ESA32429.1 nitrogen fixation protein [Leptolyngbya sp. Heron Island J]